MQQQQRGIASNPVFQKDLKSRLEMRRMPKWAAILIRLGVVMVIALFYISTIFQIFDRGEDRGLGYLLFSWMIFFAVILPPALASGSITLEREHQTWNALLLSRLKPTEIILGKFWAALLPVWGLLPVMLPLGILTTAMSKDIQWWHLGLASVFYLSLSAFTTALSLFSSWICKKTSIANGVSLLFIACYHGICSMAISIVVELLVRLHIKLPDWMESVGVFLPLILQPFLTVLLLQTMIKKLHKSAKDSDR
jgi:ABC-type transport system involved in multi-copper enzyme maturation permease subunit